MAEHRHISRSRAAGFAIALIAATAFAASESAEARPRGHGGSGSRPSSVGRTLLNRQNGGYTTGLMGVPAELPRPLANRGSLLPPPSHFPGHGGSLGQFGPGVGFNNGGFDGRGIFGPGTVQGDRFRLGFDPVSGFRFRGAVNDGNTQLRFNLNPGGVGAAPFRYDDHGHDGRHDHSHHSHFSPAYRYWPYADLWGLGWWNGYYDNYYDQNYEPQVVYAQPIYVQPSPQGAQAQPPATPPHQPTSLELGAMALYDGRIHDAVAAYRDHLKDYPEDADAMRSLAIALVQDKKVKEAVALLALAYDKDPSLVHKPMDPQMVEDGADGFREVLISTVHFSNRMRTASGYLAVTAMMQAEGRNPQALKILQKAKAAGLEAKLATEFENELNR